MAGGEQVVKQAVDLLLRAAPAGSKVILFGSHARGEARPDSDLDFLVVEPRVENRYAEAIRLREALRPARVIADILVVSERVFHDWADTPNTVIYEAAREGKVYEQVV
jgi:predicted nucleotidyltransferase